MVGIAGVSATAKKNCFTPFQEKTTTRHQGVSALTALMSPPCTQVCGARWECTLCRKNVWAEGLCRTLSLAQNLLLTRCTDSITCPRAMGGWIRVRQLDEHAKRIIERFKVKANGSQCQHAPCRAAIYRNSSLVARFDANPRLLIVSQPTWGVDVGASAQIRGEILAGKRCRLRDSGGQ